MKIKDHLRNIQESVDVIEESIRKGIGNRQRNIGFNCSAAATEMLEVYLHKENLINPSTIIKHNWFNSRKKVEEKLNFDFQDKEEIISLLIEIESKRNILCYGKPRPKLEIESVIHSFNKFKNILKNKI